MNFFPTSSVTTFLMACITRSGRKHLITQSFSMELSLIGSSNPTPVALEPHCDGNGAFSGASRSYHVFQAGKLSIK